MKWILYLLVFFILLASLGLWYLKDPGEITIIWLHYEVQFSVATGFVLFIILLCSTFILLRLFCWARYTLRYYLSFFQRSKTQKEKGELENDQK